MRHDALRRAVRLSSRRTTVECEHNLYLACEDSPQRAFFFLYFLLFSSCSLAGLGLFCTLTSLLSLSHRRQPLAAFSTRLGKTRVPCGG